MSLLTLVHPYPLPQEQRSKLQRRLQKLGMQQMRLEQHIAEVRLLSRRNSQHCLRIHLGKLNHCIHIDTCHSTEKSCAVLLHSTPGSLHTSDSALQHGPD